MGLYSNYGPDDDSTISLNQLGRIEQHQEELQAQIEDEVDRDHFRFYGKFKDSAIFDVIDFSEIITDAYDNSAKIPTIYEWLSKNEDFQDACHQLDASFEPNSASIKHLIFQTNDQNFNDLLDLIDQLFEDESFDIHYFDDDFQFVYDLNNTDDLHALAEEYYDGSY